MFASDVLSRKGQDDDLSSVFYLMDVILRRQLKTTRGYAERVGVQMILSGLEQMMIVI
jgi:hypothetical protein